MKEIPDLNAHRRSVPERLFRWLLSPRILRRLFVGVSLVITIIAVIYTRVNYRGERLWEACKNEMTAKGEAWEWPAYIPAPVPDEQNIFKAPGMAAWFKDDRPITAAPLDHTVTNQFARSLLESIPSPEPSTAAAAAAYLASSERFQPDLEKIGVALKRPYSRIVADYSRPLTMQFPNVVSCRAVAMMLEERARCHLLVGDSEKAWNDLAVLWDLRRLVEGQGKFVTTEGAWIVRGYNRHLLSVITQGVETHAWSEPQLSALETQLKDTDTLARFTDALRCGRALLIGAVENGTLIKAELGAGGMKQRTIGALEWLAPRGMMCEMLCSKQRNWQEMIEVLESTNGVVNPEQASAAFAWWPRAQEGLPALLHDQTMINEGQIACALERYRLVHQVYPATLDALLPQFIERLPRDIVNGESLKYRPTDGGGFLLYSVGWNLTDEGGKAVANLKQAEQLRQGDWVWGTARQREPGRK